MNTVNEGSTAYLTVAFFDEDGDALAPTSATWQVHDVRSGQVMQAEASIAPISASVTLTVPPAANAIVTAANERETRRVTIKAAYGTGQAINAQYDYEVINLTYVT